MPVKVSAKIQGIAFVLGVLISGIAFPATPPSLVNYQGVLRDNNDKPLSGSYDMLFRFMDASTAGNEIMIDQHAALTANPITVSGGLFNVLLGSGTITDGAGPGTYTSLDGVFRDYGGVWLEVRIGAETLSPRTPIQSAAYALNATSAVNATNASNATTATNATQLNSQPGSFYLDTSGTRQSKLGALHVEAADPGHATLDVIANPGAAESFYAHASDGSQVDMTTGGDGILAYGPTHAGEFHFSTPGLGDAYVGVAAYGIQAYGSYSGGYLNSYSSGSYSYVGVSSYKVLGSGSVAFVQNHPSDPGKVIVYAAPEGDEVAVYTRGSARLISGEAHVSLGETFALVANPDIGLTATVTPLGDPIPLSVAAKSTRELVVRGPAGSNAAFDFAVWGLRIGFEEQSIVQPKQRDSKIPSMSEHEKFFAAEPALRNFTALARFKGIDESVTGKKTFDFSSADKLRNAVGGFESKGAAENPITPGVPHRPDAMSLDDSRVTESGVPAKPSVRASDSCSPPATLLPHSTGPVAAILAFPPSTISVPVAESVDAGEVIANDATRPGELRPSATAADPGVIGIVGGDNGTRWNGTAAIALAGSIVPCKVDASFGPIAPNDLLVASPNRGFAMRAGDNPKQGTVVGKALESIEGGTGTIRVLVMSR
jgi:hypothetical protein